MRRWTTLLLAVALVGCDKPAPAPDPIQRLREAAVAAADAPCAGDAKQQLIVLETADHVMGVAWPVGDSGADGIVYLHQSDGGVCQWSAIAPDFATQGYRGLSVDNSSPAGPALAAAGVAYLRAHGAKRVFILGASMGATMGIAGAALAVPPVDGVISLSAPEAYAGAGAVESAKGLTMPILIAAAEYDTQFADAARTIYAACGSPHKHLLILPGGAHGTALLGMALQPKVTAFLQDPAGFIG